MLEREEAKMMESGPFWFVQQAKEVKRLFSSGMNFYIDAGRAILWRNFVDKGNFRLSE